MPVEPPPTEPRDRISACERALRQDPRHLESLTGLAGALLESGDPGRAAQYVSRALQIAPGSVAAMLCAGDLHLACGRIAEARRTYEQILARAPQSVAALVGLSACLARVGESALAARAARAAIDLDTGSDAAWTAFGNALRFVAFGAFDAQTGQRVVRLLELGRFEGGQLSATVYSLLARAPVGRALLAAPTAPEGCSRAIETMRDDPASGWDLLIAALRTTPIISLEFEDGLAALRSDLLRRVVAADPAPPCETLVEAIADQAELCEYVWTVAPDDATACAGLRARIDRAVASGASPPALEVLLLACFDRLDRWNLPPTAIDALGPPRAALRATQIELPAALARLAAEVESALPVRPGVSAEVRAQYEANPYPRWSPATLRDVRPAPARDAGRRVLVAGCGTGLQVAARHLARPQDRILAIDLSRASLAYARWACEKVGVRNVEFLQADLLDVDRLGRRFDEIECCGVLHHLERPVEGWRALLRCLEPDGRMLVSLYSKIARAGVLEVRRTLSPGWPRDLDGIRRLRSAIRAQGPGAPAFAVTQALDFYNASMCRDLLLHPQETDYDLLEIRAMLDKLGLDFLEFTSLPPGAAQAYLAAFPRDRLGRNLANWHRFETEHPETFLRMYNFWCAPRRR